MTSTKQKIPKGSPITGAARAKLGADLKMKYESGQAIRALMKETGRSYGFVHRILTEAGVVFRGRGGSKKKLDER